MADPTPTPTPTPAPPIPAPAPAPSPVVPPASAPDPEKGFEKALAKMGNDGLKLARRLYMDSFKDREKIRELMGRLPAEGSVVLSGDQMKAFESLNKLGKKPEEIQAALEENEEFKATEARRTVETERKGWADLCGYDAEVLSKLLDDDDIEIEVQDVPSPNGGQQKGRDGKILRAPYVKSEDPKDKRKSLFTPLTDYAQQHWAKFIPSLKGSNGVPTRPQGSPPSPPGPAPPAPPGPPQRLYGGRSPF